MLRGERLLRAWIREAARRGVRETDSGGPGVTTDPTDTDSPYGPDPERGTDVYAYWYASPGPNSTGGNFRPDDPESYIGMTPSAPEGVTRDEEPLEEDDAV